MAYQQTAVVQQPPGQVRPRLFQPGQPNTTYVQQGQPVVALQMANNSNHNRPNLARTSQKRVGIVQIVLGGAVMILGGADYVVAVRYSSILFIGYGLWCGPFMIVAGILGVVSASNQQSCAIIACMVMSILASCFAFIFFIFSTIACGLDNNRQWKFRSIDPSGMLAVDALGIIVGLAEIVIGVIQSAICCRAICCKGRQTQGATVVYVAQPFPAQYALQTQGYVQGTQIPAGNVQFSVAQPSGTVYPVGAYVTDPQPGTNSMMQQGMPPQATGPVQPIEAAVQAQGPVQPPQYGHQEDLPPAYAEKPPGV